jgi:hypothetical protein
MSSSTYLRLSLIALCLSSVVKAQTAAADNQLQTLIVFFDGLRPDYITAEGMPRLFAFRQAASYGAEHHSVFPTVTRVNSSSYSTGSYPATHGLMGNTVYFPEVDSSKGLNTGDAGQLKRIDSATKGHLLTTTASLGQILQSAGKRMMVYSSGSTGQALLQNHSLSGGITINPAMILPASESARILADIGNPPAGGENAKTGHKWVTDALVKYGLVKDGPLVNAIWYSEPDGAAHKYGIGSAEAKAALKVVDEQFGRILDSLKSRKLDLHTNILISTDHGFVTYAGKQSLPMFLIREGLKKDSSSFDVVVSEGAIYVKDHNREKITAIVNLLQKQSWAGPIFTKGTSEMKGSVPGTLSFESIHWNHKDRTADILVASNWDDEKNAAGYAGRSFSAGVAGHGGLSPYEVHIPLMAFGPSFKRSYVDSLPTSNVDLVPTVLKLHNLPIPEVMDGRVMSELMNTSKEKAPTAKKSVDKVMSADGKYVLELHRTVLGKYRYVDFAKITRL